MAADIFISYAEKDQELFDELLDHLASFDVEIFARGKIQPGDEAQLEFATAEGRVLYTSKCPMSWWRPCWRRSVVGAVNGYHLALHR